MKTTLPVVQGWVAKTAGKFAKVNLVHCDADGVVNVLPRHGVAFDLSLVAGEDRMFDKPIPKAVTISSGTFSFA